MTVVGTDDLTPVSASAARMRSSVADLCGQSGTISNSMTMATMMPQLLSSRVNQARSQS